MSFFGELNNNINEILNKLLSSDTLLRLVYFNTKDVLDKDDNDNYIHEVPKNRGSLLYDCIYPYKYIPDTSVLGKTYITMSFENIRRNKKNPYFDLGRIYFYIICDSSMVSTNSGLRYFLIMNEIDKLFSNQNIIGIGKLDFYNANIINVDNNKYTGYYMSFNVYDNI